ncbi:MAG: glycosyltransferase family 2 protein [Candidatus Omnitrophica bacterium]|nr:glycosyltransferase family 2 protein [Candidatus Omnitrophota bacterium]
MTPHVTVVVCTYNRCESLQDTLRALQAQVSDGDLSLEILVVDNNSSDRTKVVVEALAPESRWPIRYSFEPIQGLTYARNRGIQEARGEWIAFTDDDVIPEPNWIAALRQGTQTFQADGIGGRILPLWMQEPPAWLLRQPDLLGVLTLLDRGPVPIVATLKDAYFIFGANMAFRHNLFEKLGLFRTDLGVVGKTAMRGEDTEFVVRAVQAGKRVVYAPEVVVCHKVSAERMRLAYFRRVKFHTGRSESLMWSEPVDRMPRWLIRKCVEDGVRTLTAYGRGNALLGVARELTFWRRLGQLAGTLKQPVGTPTVASGNGAGHGR